MPVTNKVLLEALNGITLAGNKAVLTMHLERLSDKEQASLANKLTDAVDEDDGIDALRHAVILAHVTLGMKTENNIEALGLVLDNWSAVLCKKEIEAVVTSCNERIKNDAKKPAVLLSSSFYEYADQEERKVAGEAIQSAYKMLVSAAIAVKNLSANPDEDAKKCYEKYFGAFDKKRHEAVAENISKMLKNLDKKPLLLYYRGDHLPAISGEKDSAQKTKKANAPEFGFKKDIVKDDKHQALDDSPTNLGMAGVHNDIASTYTAKQLEKEKYRQYIDVEKCAKYVHIFMGEDAFCPDAGGSSKTEDKLAVVGPKSIAGFILHELSHFVCNTADEEDPVCKGVDGHTCYGLTNVKALAIAKPEKACNNADTYRCYFESFHTK